jgi:RimJ/RimL family protein N-acetyltransferase
MTGNWGSAQAFLERGFGFVTVGGDRVVSWSLADCVSGDEAEIGIRTDPLHRRKGLAAITAAAAVEHALGAGLRRVGWQCSVRNVGSVRTAERVGFRLEREYVIHYAMREEAAHSDEMAEAGPA